MAHADKAVKQYLSQYTDPMVPDLAQITGQWDHVLIVPVCDEHPDFMRQLMSHQGHELVLLIVVVNRPQKHPRSTDWQLSNHTLVCQWQAAAELLVSISDEVTLLSTVDGFDVLLVDHNLLPYEDHKGVGLARKVAADMALKLVVTGHIKTPWIFSTDADVILPAGYFQVPEQIGGDDLACSLRFQHISTDPQLLALQDAYDFKMYYYQQGIRFIGSAYNYIPLGSTLIIHAEAYAKIRGFPVRSGGEDFYLLNKVAKLGGVFQPEQPVVEINVRMSERVPFGTGPAIRKIRADIEQGQLPLYYHPRIFVILKKWRNQLLDYYHQQQLPVADEGLNECWDMETVLVKAMGQTNSEQRWQQFIHEWLDAFKLLKSVHFLRGRYPSLDRESLLMEPGYALVTGDE